MKKEVRDYSSDEGCKDKFNDNKSILISLGVVAIIIVILIIAMFLLNYMLKKRFSSFNISYDSIKETVKEIISESKDIINETKEDIKNTDIQIDTKKFKVEVFNAKFSFFKGTQTGEVVIKLLNEVCKLNNDKDEEHKIIIAYNTKETSDQVEIIDIRNQILEKKNYEVVYYYDEDGYLNRIAIIRKK